MGTFKQRTTMRHMIVAGACMPDHVRYAKLHAGGDKRQTLLVLSPEGVTAKEKGDAQVDDLVTFNFKPDAAYYITLVFRKSRHAIGIAGTHGTNFTFFDPNAGEYEVPGAMFDRFLTAYKEIVQETIKFGTIRKVIIAKARLA